MVMWLWPVGVYISGQTSLGWWCSMSWVWHSLIQLHAYGYSV